MSYQPIENYGVIGNMRTVALVGMNGSIDWFCCPNFDSPSIFAAILDDNIGGRFKIAPVSDGVTTKQMYWPETNVLVSRFLSEDGVGEVIDFMPVGVAEHYQASRQIVRRGPGQYDLSNGLYSGFPLRPGRARYQANSRRRPVQHP